jgi:membrane-associated phospholipid phosphatase
VLFLAFILLFLVTWGVVYALMPLTRGGLGLVARTVVRNARVAKLVKRHGDRLRDYWPVILLPIVGGALTLWAGDSFLDLAELVHAKSTVLQSTDLRMHDWVITRRANGATLFFTTMTLIGGPSGVGVIAILAAIALAVVRRWRWLIYLGVTAAGGSLADLELKLYFARARPDVAEMLRAAHGYSFPSGHAMGSTVVFGALAYLGARMLRSWRWKAAVIALAIVLVVAVALSRVYLGVHWMSDIAAGVSAGLLWLTTTTVSYEVLRRIRHLRGLRAANQERVLRSSNRDGARGA